MGCCLATVLLAAPPAAADSIRDREWHLNYLNVTAAQVQSQGDGVVVAVVDTGVNGNHPDLAGNVLPGVDVSGAGAPNGQQDTDGHGTAMASLIAGHGHGTGNGDGVLGIAPQAKIFPVRDALGSKSVHRTRSRPGSKRRSSPAQKSSRFPKADPTFHALGRPSPPL